MALTKIGRLVDKGIVKDQTNLGAEAADTDEYLLYDASADELKAIQSQNVFGAGTITNKTSLVAADLAADDVLLIYDTSTGSLKKIAKSDLVAAQPTFTSVTPSNALSGDGTGNYSFTIAGTGYEESSVVFIGNDATEYSADTTTTDSTTQLTAVIAKSSLPVDNEPYDIKITNSNTFTTTQADAFNIDAQPSWTTASGSLGSIFDSSRGSASFTIQATDPESGAITINTTLVSGTLPAGSTLVDNGDGTATISGFSAVGSDTTSTFTVRAADANSNTADRQFSITVKAPTATSFTSSGTFSVPSGVSSVNVLVVAGGGGAGYDASGGAGAGGLIYRPGFSVTPGGTVSVTVGDGGTPSGAAVGGPNGNNGQDSVFGTLTAKGGGAGGSKQNTGSTGGSGGGSGHNNPGGGQPGAGATQPTQPGDSGTYGFGNAGGSSTQNEAGGGGGAGAAGTPGSQNGPGGIGKAYTIADGTTSVYYAGGGGGSGFGYNSTEGLGGQGGGGQGGYGGGAGCNPTGGQANRGGGAGGGNGSYFPGGKGIVIVQY